MAEAHGFSAARTKPGMPGPDGIVTSFADLGDLSLHRSNHTPALTRTAVAFSIESLFVY